MSLETRVSDALQDWSGQSPVDFTMTVEDLWILRNSPPFDPDGIELLIQALEKEFQNAPSFQVTLSPPDFRAGGKVKTIQNLIDEAATFPESESDAMEVAAPAKKVAGKKAAKKTASAKFRPITPGKKVVAKRPAKKLAVTKKAAAKKGPVKKSVKKGAKKGAKKPSAGKATRGRRS